MIGRFAGARGGGDGSVGVHHKHVQLELVSLRGGYSGPIGCQTGGRQWRCRRGPPIIDRIRIDVRAFDLMGIPDGAVGPHNEDVFSGAIPHHRSDIRSGGRASGRHPLDRRLPAAPPSCNLIEEGPCVAHGARLVDDEGVELANIACDGGYTGSWRRQVSRRQRYGCVPSAVVYLERAPQGSVGADDEDIFLDAVSHHGGHLGTGWCQSRPRQEHRFGPAAPGPAALVVGLISLCGHEPELAP